jgi:signal transduction histidine kinase
MSIRRVGSKRADLTLAAALAILFLAEVLGESGFHGKRPFSALLGVAFAASLALRRRLPLVPLALALVLIEVANLAGPQALAETAAFLFAVVIAIYSAGAYARGRAQLVAVVLVAAAIPLAAIEPGKSLTASDLGFFVMFFGGPFVAGQVMRRRRARERALEVKTVALERDGEERARTAVADERARIARELHDVIAHAVSVVVLQARGARRVVTPEQGEVKTALDTIEQSASDALTEMRRLLSLLREQEDEYPSLSPQPSLRRVEALVDSVRAAGLPVELTIDGPLEDLPAGLDVSGYRIVQEALTNALKHAGPARARVHINRRADELEIQVSDDGSGGIGAPGTGHGLVGMRERVAVYGGRLEAGPNGGGGFVLRASLPLEPTV